MKVEYINKRWNVFNLFGISKLRLLSNLIDALKIPKINAFRKL